MADRITLKSWFETGDKPTQAQFAELIDSLALTTEIPVLATLAETLAGTNNSKGISPYLLAQAIADRLINNLTAGGTSKILTAEMGKQLQNNKTNRDYSIAPLNTAERTSWLEGLGIIRKGVTRVLTGVTGVTSAVGNLSFATIPGFNPLTHKLFANILVKSTGQSAGSFIFNNNYILYIKDYKDSYFKYEAYHASTTVSFAPLDVYVSWLIVEN